MPENSSSSSHTGWSFSCTADFFSETQTMSMMVKLPPRRVIDVSPRFQLRSNKAWLILATIPGKSLPTKVSINQFSISKPPID